jgi:hypothetical protein
MNKSGMMNCFSEAHKSSFGKKLFSPQMLSNNSGGLANNGVMSAGKTNERLMDRFIPCRMGENL